MILDDLMKLRSGGSSPAVSATEAGSTSLTRDATTGKVVVQVDKMPPGGLPVLVTNVADTGTSTDKTAVVTIEAADDLAFTTPEVIATFPTYSHGAAAGKAVRRVTTMKKYLRSVVTVAGSNGTIGIDFGIYVGIGALNEG